MSDTLQKTRRPPEIVLPVQSAHPPVVAAPGTRRKRIVIVGGGFAGIAAARALKRM